jgi:integrase
MEGSMKVVMVRKRKSGPPMYEIRFRYKDPRSGTVARFRRRYALQRREAEELGHALQGAARSGRLAEVLDAAESPSTRAPGKQEDGKDVEDSKEDTPIVEFLWHWYELYAPENKPAERTNKEEVIRLHLAPFFDGYRVGGVTSEDVQAFKRWMEAQPNGRGGTYAPRSINKCLTALKTAYTSAVAWGYAASNPVRGVKMVKVMETDDDFENYLDEVEVRAYLEVVRDRYPQWYAQVLTLVSTGMRLGESFGLEKRDLHWRQETISIMRTVDAKGNVHSPKSGRSRTIQVHGEVLRILREHCKKTTGSMIVFPNAEGRRYRDGNSLRRPHKAAVELVGVTKNVTLHGLRHSAGTLLASQGANEEQIRRFLGHASTKMVQRYMHLGRKHDRRTANLLAEAIGLVLPNEAEEEFRGQCNVNSLSPDAGRSGSGLK